MIVLRECCGAVEPFEMHGGWWYRAQRGFYEVSVKSELEMLTSPLAVQAAASSVLRG
jgi:hypothetical protein